MIQRLNRADIEFADRFEKQLIDTPDEIKEALLDTLELFLEDPHNPFLRNHPLKEKFAGYRSIDVTDNWRAVFKETYAGDRIVITFYLIGTHEALYG